MELIPDVISNKTIEKCKSIHGVEATNTAVSCIYNWYDKFYDTVFKPARNSDTKLIKAVIYLLMTNGYNDHRKPEYINYLKTR